MQMGFNKSKILVNLFLQLYFVKTTTEEQCQTPSPNTVIEDSLNIESTIQEILKDCDFAALIDKLQEEEEYKSCIHTDERNMPKRPAKRKSSEHGIEDIFDKKLIIESTNRTIRLDDQMVPQNDKHHNNQAARKVKIDEYKNVIEKPFEYAKIEQDSKEYNFKSYKLEKKNNETFKSIFSAFNLRKKSIDFDSCSASINDFIIEIKGIVEKNNFNIDYFIEFGIKIIGRIEKTDKDSYRFVCKFIPELYHYIKFIINNINNIREKHTNDDLNDYFKAELLLYIETLNNFMFKDAATTSAKNFAEETSAKNEFKNVVHKMRSQILKTLEIYFHKSNAHFLYVYAHQKSQNPQFNDSKDIKCHFVLSFIFGKTNDKDYFEKEVNKRQNNKTNTIENESIEYLCDYFVHFFALKSIFENSMNNMIDHLQTFDYLNDSQRTKYKFD